MIGFFIDLTILQFVWAFGMGQKTRFSDIPSASRMLSGIGEKYKCRNNQINLSVRKLTFEQGTT